MHFGTAVFWMIAFSIGGFWVGHFTLPQFTLVGAWAVFTAFLAGVWASVWGGMLWFFAPWFVFWPIVIALSWSIGYSTEDEEHPNVFAAIVFFVFLLIVVNFFGTNIISWIQESGAKIWYWVAGLLACAITTVSWYWSKYTEREAARYRERRERHIQEYGRDSWEKHLRTHHEDETNFEKREQHIKEMGQESWDAYIMNHPDEQPNARTAMSENKARIFTWFAFSPFLLPWLLFRDPLKHLWELISPFLNRFLETIYKRNMKDAYEDMERIKKKREASLQAQAAPAESK